MNIDLRRRRLLAMTIIAIAAFFSTTTMAGQHSEISAFKATIIKPHLTLLQGKGGNILVSHGEDGLLIIDNDYADMSQQLLAEIDKLGGSNKLKYVINTHWHGDHTGGNAVLGVNTTIIGHENVRKRLSTRQQIKFFNMTSEAAPKQALPKITYADTINIHFNGEKIRLQHYPNAHTDSDTIIFFEGSKVIHTGDLLFNNMYPFVDTSSGGNPISFIQHHKQIRTQVEPGTRISTTTAADPISTAR